MSKDPAQNKMISSLSDDDTNDSDNADDVTTIADKSDVKEEDGEELDGDVKEALGLIKKKKTKASLSDVDYIPSQEQEELDSLSDI